ncbi:hypothetical protein [Enhygromyxa salina]|uniref:hypothetical protein n=1 Tax=Enhygromyxa salina TaxID=215803 RepID=UPI0015E79EBA|nr:hypothetical protein [Enhygromyxa salina]
MALATACGSSPEPDVRVEEFDLRTEIDIEAAVYAGPLYAVGSTSVIEESGTSWDLGVPLHGIAYVDEAGFPAVLAVVGDGGYVALARYGYNSGGFQEFTQEPTNIEADLLGVAGYFEMKDQLTLIVVGEDTLGVGQGIPEEGPLVWTATQPPPGGWGHLRDIRLEDDDVCVLGDAGALFCADVTTMIWGRVELDTDENLTRFCGGLRWEAVGSNGTVVIRGLPAEDTSVWTTAQVGSVDLVACSSGFSAAPVVVGANRTIYEVVDPTHAQRLVTLDWQPLTFDRETGFVMAGEGGHGGYLVEVKSY